jgi:hypothetical protein
MIGVIEIVFCIGVERINNTSVMQNITEQHYLLFFSIQHFVLVRLLLHNYVMKSFVLSETVMADDTDI